jgi:hypothetical protein
MGGAYRRADGQGDGAGVGIMRIGLESMCDVSGCLTKRVNNIECKRRMNTWVSWLGYN